MTSNKTGTYIYLPIAIPEKISMEFELISKDSFKYKLKLNLSFTMDVEKFIEKALINDIKNIGYIKIIEKLIQTELEELLKGISLITNNELNNNNIFEIHKNVIKSQLDQSFFIKIQNKFHINCNIMDEISCIYLIDTNNDSYKKLLKKL